MAQPVQYENARQGLHAVWTQLKALFAEHHFLTLVCAFFVVMMVLSFYRLLRSINPALVGLVLFMVFLLLVLHWTQTRTEPKFLTPFIDLLAPHLTMPVR
ncbi:hypothetical protein [Opitutus sp. ER46]|uniref:hypothetical protein n=1 Tax=Opitutus sp. ER46 TaxID=2161864 RepID=UPI000D31EC73|nr:hypothetical protein [Opitutus sp. ER46]PTY00065.1 hypothetical protein DB354_01900 [Opitutus sp. ER46]